MNQLDLSFVKMHACTNRHSAIIIEISNTEIMSKSKGL